MALNYYILYKPYGVITRFTSDRKDHITLASLGNFPKDVYPVGRLDKDSEGLLLLSNDKTLNHRLLDPKYRHRRSYWVQVEGEIPATSINQLSRGVKIRINKKEHLTSPAQVTILDPPPMIPARIPPVRFRKFIPTSWIFIQLTEGKNRQIRRMCAAVGFPVLRLIRIAIEDLDIRSLMKPGEIRTISRTELYQKLNI